MFDPSRPRQSVDRSALENVEHMVRKKLPYSGELVNISSSAIVHVSEVTCSDPGCPVHTVVIVFTDGEGAAGRVTFRMKKPASEIKEEDAKAAFRLALEEAESGVQQVADEVREGRSATPPRWDWQQTICTCCDPPGYHPPGTCTCCYPGEPPGLKQRAGCGCCCWRCASHTSPSGAVSHSHPTSPRFIAVMHVGMIPRPIGGSISIK